MSGVPIRPGGIHGRCAPIPDDVVALPRFSAVCICCEQVWGLQNHNTPSVGRCNIQYGAWGLPDAGQQQSAFHCREEKLGPCSGFSLR